MRIISGAFKGRKLLSPKTTKTRPSSERLRETVFNMLAQEIKGATFLDAFAGSGAMGLEALSRGAKSVTFVDTHPQTLQKNCALLGVKPRILRKKVLLALKLFAQEQQTFDIIFADPPYGEHLADELLAFLDETPLLAKEGTLLIEEREKLHYQPKNFILHSTRKVGSTTLSHYIPTKP